MVSISDIGYIEFKAKYREQGKAIVIHERSEFHRINGVWCYVGGKQYGDRPKRAGKRYAK